MCRASELVYLSCVRAVCCYGLTRVLVQAIHVEVPRKIYVNCRKERGPDFGRLVKHTLPHRRPAYFLYELTMPERRFLRYTKDLARLLSDPDVEGVYETKVRCVRRRGYLFHEQIWVLGEPCICVCVCVEGGGCGV